MRLRQCLFVISALALASGCVMVPYTPDAEIEHVAAEMPPPDKILLTIGPREFLDAMAEEVAQRERRVVIRPSLEFRDMVFPDGGWTLANLYAPETKERLRTAGTDFLVALSPVRYSEDESDNKMAVWVGFYGVADVDTKAGLSALVVDLAENSRIDLLVAESDAAIRGVGLFYGLFLVPRTQHSVKEAIAEELTVVLRNAKPNGQIRVAFMAAESASAEEDPLQPSGR